MSDHSVSEGKGLRLNLGCGRNRVLGWVNVDKEADLNPDLTFDLETVPWPWADNSVTEVRLIHVLEHLGERRSDFLALIKELYRVCSNGAQITIIVPHPRSDDYISDPTHVRPITPKMLSLFDQGLNREWERTGMSDTALGFLLGVDFRIKSLEFFLEEPWLGRMQSGQMTRAQLSEAERSYSNVIKQTQILWEVVKAP